MRCRGATLTPLGRVAGPSTHLLQAERAGLVSVVEASGIVSEDDGDGSSQGTKKRGPSAFEFFLEPLHHDTSSLRDVELERFVKEYIAIPGGRNVRLPCPEGFECLTEARQDTDICALRWVQVRRSEVSANSRGSSSKKAPKTAKGGALSEAMFSTEPAAEVEENDEEMIFVVPPEGMVRCVTKSVLLCSCSLRASG